MARWMTLLGLLCTGCLATKVGSADEAAGSILAKIDNGKPGRAAETFEAASDKGYADQIYPVLFTEAGRRYDAGEVSSAVPVLRFMAEHYPEAMSVREALVYGLFLERAATTSPKPELVTELEEASAALREEAPGATQFLPLIEAQIAIDRGRMDDARVSFEEFIAKWNGSPADLEIYVEDVGRYLASH